MKLILYLALCILLFNCTNKYDKYKATPKYITNAVASNKAYFEAYNESLKLWDVNFEELYIPTTYGVAHVIVSGKSNKESVVLLHGMNASSTMWYPNIKSLSDNYRVFAIDFILEPGKSCIQKDIDDIETIIDWYNEIFYALDLNNFNLIGASRGGWLATNLTLNNPEKIKKLVLLSPAQTFTWIKPSSDLLKNIIYVFSSKEKRVNQTLEAMSNNPNNISDTYIKQYKIGTGKDTLNKLMLKMKPFSRNELKNLKLPTLVLIGDNDAINNEKTIELAKTLPKGQGEIITNAGHFLSIDQADAINTKILEFLNN